MRANITNIICDFGLHGHLSSVYIFFLKFCTWTLTWECVFVQDIIICCQGCIYGEGGRGGPSFPLEEHLPPPPGLSQVEYKESLHVRVLLLIVLDRYSPGFSVPCI